MTEYGKGLLPSPYSVVLTPDMVMQFQIES